MDKVVTKKKRPFNRKDIGFKKGKRARRNNQDRYLEWVISVLKEEHPKILEKNQNYFAPSILMNKENLEWLQNELYPMVYLCYAPTEDDTLMDDELGIDTDMLIEEVEKDVRL